jgi:hypothetical protein
VDVWANKFKSNPGPQHKSYNIVKKWEEYLPKKRGLFTKKERMTMTEECMNISKPMPAPGKYPTNKYGDMKFWQRINGNYKSKDNPVFFTDAAKKAAKKVPA